MCARLVGVRLIPKTQAVRILILLLAVVPQSLAAAQKPSVTNEFKGRGICRFALHDSALSPQMEATINGGVVQVLGLYKATFGLTNLPAMTINVRLFRKLEDFKIYHSRHSEESLAWSAGVYISRKREIAMWVKPKPEKFLEAIYHEASHAIMHRAVGITPHWFNEGSAEYFSKLMMSRTRIGNEVWREGLFPCKKMLRENRLPSLDAILNYTEADQRDIKPYEVYAVSWSLVQFLVSNPARKQVLQKYVRHLADGRGLGVDSAKVLTELYAGGLSKMEREWRAWLASA